MQPGVAKKLLRSSKTTGKLLPEASFLLIPERTFCFRLDDDLRVNAHNCLEMLLTKESPLLRTVTEWSKYYYNQSSKICQKYYKENIMITPDKALSTCKNSIRQSGIEWNTERQKRITGSTCFFLYKYCKSMNPNWERRFEFAHRAKDFPLYLTQATTHGLSHQNAAQRKYRERLNGGRLLNLGLVIHPKLPFLSFSPDGIVLDKNGKPQNLIEIKCPLDGRSFSSEDLLKLATFTDQNGLIRSNYKYYGQIQLGMFLLGLPYCDFILYSSSECDYISKRINFDEVFVKEMMGSLVHVYFKKMLPWLIKKDLSVGWSSKI